MMRVVHLFNRVNPWITRGCVVTLLAGACLLAFEGVPSTESRTASAVRSPELPAALRPVVLQTLNAEAGPEFAIVADVSTASQWQVSAPTTRFRAANPKHDFATEFTTEGVRIVPADARVPSLQLTLDHIGHADHVERAEMGDWETRGLRIERHSSNAAMSEWYVNGPLGLEQGFTIDAPPRGEGPLTVQLALNAPWSARAREADRTVDFVEEHSKRVLTYGELYAFGADGRPLPATLEPTPRGVAIRVDAEGARYPITIDPFIQQQTLSVAGLAAGDQFGYSVAITADGSTAVVGAPGRDISLGNINPLTFENSGAAYVFVRTAQSWQMQAQLSTGGILSAEGGRQFGHAVAVSGDTAVVTAPFEDVDGRADAGVAYAFRRGAMTWTLVQTLTAPVLNRRHFGLVVAMDLTSSLDLIAMTSQSALGLKENLHIYRGDSGVWSHRETHSFDALITSLAMSGLTTVVGVPGSAPGAFIVSANLNNPATVRPLSAPDGASSDLFGASVAISGDVVLIGAPGRSNFRGAGYVFRGAGENWAFEQKLETNTTVNALPALGDFVAISPEAIGGRAAILAGLPVAGTADIAIFRRGATSWTFEQGLVDRGGLHSLAVGLDFSSGLPLLLLGTPGAAGGTGVAVVYGGVASAPLPPGGFVAPTLSPAVVTGSTVQLNWGAVSGATSYRLRAGTTPGTSNAFDGNVGATTTLTAVTVPNGSYFVRVHSVGGSGESGPSNEVRVNVGPTSSCSPPSGPTNLRATVNGAVVTLQWNAASGAASYIVEAGSASGLANLATLDVGPITSFMASAPPGTYFVGVRMRNACGDTAVSNEIIVQVS